VELMWLLGRLNPDHKSIAGFRRIHREAVKEAGVELVRFAKNCGLIRGEWIAIDGSKFRAVASIDCARERFDRNDISTAWKKLTKSNKPVSINLPCKLLLKS
jgi:hypothetical protein